MTAALASAVLRRAGMISLVLALIAGIFGMHVMDGRHIMHGPTNAVTAASAGHTHHSRPAGEAVHDVGEAAADAAQAAAEGISAGAACPDGNCSGTQAVTVSCIPAGKTGTLAAPPPGTAVLAAAPVRAGPAGQMSGRSAHTPDTPTPCELSISRT